MPRIGGASRVGASLRARRKKEAENKKRVKTGNERVDTRTFQEGALSHDGMTIGLADDLCEQTLGQRHRLGVAPPTSTDGYIDHDRGRPRVALAMREHMLGETRSYVKFIHDDYEGWVRPEEDEATRIRRKKYGGALPGIERADAAQLRELALKRIMSDSILNETSDHRPNDKGSASGKRATTPERSELVLNLASTLSKVSFSPARSDDVGTGDKGGVFDAVAFDVDEDTTNA
mmetsp:Transcript_13222/g.28034  ORF Transcript_13222/g.28034 Transcript_13222/m.28034 type:complete len:233 (-) Transcript_13222:263-961(-)|eukprot:CAMPEP_0118946298 /NCGR_PEP_ID=MMETSP1169-20130426/43980_1 /TAXON_ID=36882 /ORGANISM="Pyramimonas obovata, Strain CCMP722" /LENGTH=232 /DNA_ID=CAMNT_0006892231 /DNA_START=200 /DNA_END=898 /DNA_ORIENTATION=+